MVDAAKEVLRVRDEVVRVTDPKSPAAIRSDLSEAVRAFLDTADAVFDNWPPGGEEWTRYDEALEGLRRASVTFGEPQEIAQNAAIRRESDAKPSDAYPSPGFDDWREQAEWWEHTCVWWHEQADREHTRADSLIELVERAWQVADRAR